LRLVLDASVALKWFFGDRPGEDHTAAAAALLVRYGRGEFELLAPPHFTAEVCALLVRESPHSIAANLRDLFALGIGVRDDAAVHARATALSLELRHHLFDTLYHAVALETPGALLITADDTYLRKARAAGRIRHLFEPLPGNGR
jgi:predicted nucleic acid-binding protein